MPLLKKDLIKMKMDPEWDEWDPDQEQENLENPDDDECPTSPIELDPDLDEAPPIYDIYPWGEDPLYDHAGVTAEGYALLAEMDSQGEFL